MIEVWCDFRAIVAIEVWCDFRWRDFRWRDFRRRDFRVIEDFRWRDFRRRDFRTIVAIEVWRDFRRRDFRAIVAIEVWRDFRRRYFRAIVAIEVWRDFRVDLDIVGGARAPEWGFRRGVDFGSVGERSSSRVVVVASRYIARARVNVRSRGRFRVGRRRGRRRGRKVDDQDEDQGDDEVEGRRRARCVSSDAHDTTLVCVRMSCACGFEVVWAICEYIYDLKKG